MFLALISWWRIGLDKFFFSSFGWWHFALLCIKFVSDTKPISLRANLYRYQWGFRISRPLNNAKWGNMLIELLMMLVLQIFHHRFQILLSYSNFLSGSFCKYHNYCLQCALRSHDYRILLPWVDKISTGTAYLQQDGGSTLLQLQSILLLTTINSCWDSHFHDWLLYMKNTNSKRELNTNLAQFIIWRNVKVRRKVNVKLLTHCGES